MTLATLGWGVWWFSVLLHKFMPGLTPGLGLTYVVTCALAGLGFCLAFFTLRARLIWVLLAGVPMFANGTLLLLPVLLSDEVEVLLTTRNSGGNEDASKDAAGTDRPADQ